MNTTETNIATIQPEEVAAIPSKVTNWRDLLSYFVSTQDVKESSRRLYSRTLKLFFEWVEEKGKVIAGLTRTDILEYKEDGKSGRR